MKTAATLAAAIAAAVAASFTLNAFQSKKADATPGGDTLATLQQQVQTQQRLIDEQQRALDQLKSRPVTIGNERSADPTVSKEQLDAAVARWLAKNPSAVPAVAEAAGKPGKAGEAVAGPAVSELFTQLCVPDLSDEKWTELWRQAQSAGKTDELIGMFEKMAADQPRSADAQTALGAAYIAKLLQVPDQEKGTWSLKSDKQFDKALELDPNHWDARYTKAVSLSFWPPVFGKGPEAISHFETLVKQQELAGNHKPQHAQTYVFLGNMYMQVNKEAEARAAYAKGLRAFPEHAELKKLAAKK